MHIEHAYFSANRLASYFSALEKNSSISSIEGFFWADDEALFFVFFVVVVSITSERLEADNSLLQPTI